ncbi:ABC transporter permease [Granulosicoccus antarcticus]|uniref:Transport permease protein n=1 Tax=Granulosicoccus antarcticus IMCC3135 TaxID=1192854 RepID=A0A2Z2NST7_9GAMM|nr:ABC transporter permease [Granulosicoccus antarcticus]ASJ70234.1 Inner membrane transport permease YbhR [Granulosicoccus antarcticus IMCC3135]
MKLYWLAMAGIVRRELMRFLQQRERFIAALVRPLLWLVVFAAGFRAALGLSIIPPYQTYISYEVYIVPGLIGMIQLFNGMQSSLSMVYDQEMGSMRVLLTAPLPRWYLLLCKLLASVMVSLMQIATFLLVAWIAGIEFAFDGVLLALPVMILTGILLGSLGLLIASLVKQLENFAGVMNFVIFPMFFLSSALYPIWKMRESSDWLARICQWNPFSHAVEAIRFAFYGQFNFIALLVVTGCTLAFFMAASWSYNPARRFRAARTASA